MFWLEFKRQKSLKKPINTGFCEGKKDIERINTLKELKHLSEVYKNYDTFVIDLWGVMHDGVTLNLKAIEAVDFLYKNSKKIVFLSNAPRPSSKVINFIQDFSNN